MQCASAVLDTWHLEPLGNDLVATGALQNGNQMDLESLLNPVGESCTLTGASDKEIYQAVMDAREACKTLEINGGDDIDEVPLEPRPTRVDVFKAVSTISKHLDDINDPLVRKVEEILGLLNRMLQLQEAQNMKTTIITDYFSKY